MDAKGIEPSFTACKAVVFPLDDAPDVGWGFWIRTRDGAFRERCLSSLAKPQWLPTLDSNQERLH